MYMTAGGLSSIFYIHFFCRGKELTTFSSGQGYTSPHGTAMGKGGHEMVIYLDIAFLLNCVADAAALAEKYIFPDLFQGDEA